MKRRDPLERVKLGLAESKAERQLTKQLRDTVRRWRKRRNRLLPPKSVNKIARRWNKFLTVFS